MVASSGPSGLSSQAGASNTGDLFSGVSKAVPSSPARMFPIVGKSPKPEGQSKKVSHETPANVPYVMGMSRVPPFGANGTPLSDKRVSTPLSGKRANTPVPSMRDSTPVPFKKIKVRMEALEASGDPVAFDQTPPVLQTNSTYPPKTNSTYPPEVKPVFASEVKPAFRPEAKPVPQNKSKAVPFSLNKQSKATTANVEAKALGKKKKKKKDNNKRKNDNNNNWKNDNSKGKNNKRKSDA
ncbi:hypothetical protein B0T18DRAFT_427946 [Schizothecium vesticola]|uniref:Uncharacterized protein n=1 Tax=Schizothecium vesticola TaxID=314040 RepID=A0AA40K8H6_9PEZI|nr:hypothetical protein B0T18DRAFT_427946 [Schizothecium vesticola]